MPTKKFIHTHRVTYSSCTVGNHVYYARYLDMLEEARGEFFRQLGKPLLMLHGENLEFPVRECHIRYAAPARYDDVVQIELLVNHLDRLWVRFGFAIRSEQDALIAEGETAHVCTNTAQKPIRMPKHLMNLLGEFSIKDSD